MTVVVDTNVILVANRQHGEVSERCRVACLRRLRQIVQGERIVLDDRHRILSEYQNKTSPRRGKQAGDVFVKWVLRNNANPARCDLVALEEHESRGFASFPEDARLENFDAQDRKFVAVAAAHGGAPPILQAADSKWLGWAKPLKDHGVKVVFLCPKDIRHFDDEKRKRKRKGRQR